MRTFCATKIARMSVLFFRFLFIFYLEPSKNNLLLLLMGAGSIFCTFSAIMEFFWPSAHQGTSWALFTKWAQNILAIVRSKAGTVRKDNFSRSAHPCLGIEDDHASALTNSANVRKKSVAEHNHIITSTKSMPTILNFVIFVHSHKIDCPSSLMGGVYRKLIEKYFAVSLRFSNFISTKSQQISAKSQQNLSKISAKSQQNLY